MVLTCGSYRALADVENDLVGSHGEIKRLKKEMEEKNKSLEESAAQALNGVCTRPMCHRPVHLQKGCSRNTFLIFLCDAKQLIYLRG